MPPRICVTDATSVKSSPSKVTRRGATAASCAIPAAARWMALSASHGRAEWPLRPRKVHVALRLPRQPAWSALAVGSMTSTRSARAQRRLAGQQRRQRALGDRQLLAAEEHEAEVDRAGRRRPARPARARASPPPRPSCRPRRGRGRRRRRGGPGGCPARARCRGGRRGARAGARGARVTPASTHVSPASRAGVAAVAQHAQHVGGQRGLVARLATARRRARACARRGVAPGRRSRAARRGMLRRCASAGSTSPPARPTSSS